MWGVEKRKAEIFENTTVKLKLDMETEKSERNDYAKTISLFKYNKYES